MTGELNTEAIKNLLKHPIAFHRVFADIAGGATPGLFLSQAWYWSQKSDDPDGWFYHTQQKWEEETALTRQEQELARKKLQQTTFWEERKRALPAKLWFRIDHEKFFMAIATARSPVTIETLLEEKAQFIQLSKAGYMRAKKAGAEGEMVQYVDIIREHGMLCAHCSEPIQYGPGKGDGCLTFGYLAQLSDGGTHNASNIRPLHRACVKQATDVSSKQTSLLTVSRLECLPKADLSASSKQTNTETILETQTETIKNKNSLSSNDDQQVTPPYFGEENTNTDHGDEGIAAEGQPSFSPPPQFPQAIKSQKKTKTPPLRFPVGALTPSGLIDLYNTVTPTGHPKVERKSPGRLQKAATQLKNFPDEAYWRSVFEGVVQSVFLRGERNSPGHESFIAKFDWFLQKGKDGIENHVKVYEGKYRDKDAETPASLSERQSPSLADILSQRR